MITEAAPAKINLYLHVVGRRQNGYHELDSLVAFTEAGDVVTVTPVDPGAGLSLKITGPFAPVLAGEDPSRNLVVQAATALAAVLDRPADLAIELDKRLPVASGIGGGSADAAATLRALARLWDIPADDSRLFAIAATLGADVPVCIASKSSFFGGIGEVLSPAPTLPAVQAVLVNPGIPVPTPAVFRERVGLFSDPARFTETPVDAHDLADRLQRRRNDLTGPAARVAPTILSVLETVAATRDCLLSRLSGSGATCFGLYADPETARSAAERIAGRHPDWWVRPTRFL